MIDLSVVIPIRNEAPSLVELHREFTDTLKAWGRTYEILVIDDGSTDESFTILAKLQASDPHLRVIRFRGTSVRPPPSPRVRARAQPLDCHL
jgi:glycosyltransferase involved in cell wall biosynthesis